MSEGPIKRWRESWKRDRVSTTEKDRVCMVTGAPEGLSTYCGRARRNVATEWENVVCADCLAAAVADGVLR